MGWLITLGILTLLAILPLGVSVRYDEDGAVVRVIAGPVKITLFPRKNKEKKPRKEKVGVAVESIGHIECGARKPSLNLLYNIAEVLGVSLDYLTGRTENSSDALLLECADSNDLTGEQEQMLLELCRSMIPVIKKRS